MKRLLFIIGVLITVIIVIARLTEQEPNCNSLGCDFPIIIEGYDTTSLDTINIVKYTHKNNYKTPIDTLRIVEESFSTYNVTHYASIGLPKPLDVSFDYIIIIEKDTFKISDIEMEYRQSWKRCFIKKYTLNNTDTGHSNITLRNPNLLN